jgi:hypothetical protein
LYIFHLVSNKKLVLVRELLNKYCVDAYDAGHVNALGQSLCDVARERGVLELINLCQSAYNVYCAALNTVHLSALCKYIIPPPRWLAWCWPFWTSRFQYKESADHLRLGQFQSAQAHTP